VTSIGFLSEGGNRAMGQLPKLILGEFTDGIEVVSNSAVYQAQTAA
jgi:hypothetical protein